MEVVANDSNPYIFCYACATELKRETVYRWDGSRLVAVLLRAPALALPDTVREQADRAVALAQADLWRQAAEAASLASTRAPANGEIRWLSILINRVASARLAYAGSPGQPLLTSVFAGEYEAAVDLMRALDPTDAFALDGPLIVGTAAEQSLSTMAVQLLNYAERPLLSIQNAPAFMRFARWPNPRVTGQPCRSPIRHAAGYRARARRLVLCGEPRISRPSSGSSWHTAGIAGRRDAAGGASRHVLHRWPGDRNRRPRGGLSRPCIIGLRGFVRSNSAIRDAISTPITRRRARRWCGFKTSEGFRRVA